MVFYSVNMSNPEIKEFKVYINVSELNPLIQKIKDYSDRIILYGSCAEGTDTEKSDIDLFILTEDKEKVMDEIKKFKIDRKIVPVIMDNMEFINIKQKDKAFYDQISKGKELWRRSS
jgi:predicted nucleotidyltransferase